MTTGPSLSALVEVIREQHHAPLLGLIEHLATLAANVNSLAVARASRETAQSCKWVHGTLQYMDELFRLHVEKAEGVLFPWILSGDGANARQPVHLLLREHQEIDGLLERLGTLAEEVEASVISDSDEWRELRAQLSCLHALMRHHIALEHTRLFPRTLRGDDPHERGVR